MKPWLLVLLVAASALMAGCAQEATPDSSETVKEIQAQNRAQDPPVPESLRSRGGNTPARGGGVK
jgi:type IV pilus biogenesis protein CpaD/CtpE